jgi:hypothetical protein
MNYLTNYYKNLSEQLQEKVNNLTKLLEASATMSMEMQRRKELEQAAMNPSNRITPIPQNMTQREAEQDPMIKISRANREKERENLISNVNAINSLGVPLAVAAAPNPKAALVAGVGYGAFSIGQNIGTKMGLDTAESNLELEKIRKTAGALPSDYEKAAREAAAKRKERGIKTYE